MDIDETSMDMNGYLIRIHGYKWKDMNRSSMDTNGLSMDMKVLSMMD